MEKDYTYSICHSFFLAQHDVWIFIVFDLHIKECVSIYVIDRILALLLIVAYAILMIQKIVYCAPREKTIICVPRWSWVLRRSQVFTCPLVHYYFFNCTFPSHLFSMLKTGKTNQYYSADYLDVIENTWYNEIQERVLVKLRWNCSAAPLLVYTVLVRHLITFSLWLEYVYLYCILVNTCVNFYMWCVIYNIPN